MKPIEKPIKGDKRSFVCDLCYVDLSSEKAMNDHKIGKKLGFCMQYA